MTTPTDADRQAAEKIAGEAELEVMAFRSQDPEALDRLNAAMIQLRMDIAQAIADARAVPVNFREAVADVVAKATNILHEDIVDDIAALVSKRIADARAVRPGHVRLDTGEEVRVLGTLPMTKDGCLLGEGSIVWREAAASMTGTVRPEKLELAWGFYNLDGAHRTKAGGWYSTKEAAESALAARGEK